MAIKKDGSYQKLQIPISKTSEPNLVDVLPHLWDYPGARVRRASRQLPGYFTIEVPRDRTEKEDK
jgi:hypothetical protein